MTPAPAINGDRNGNGVNHTDHPYSLQNLFGVGGTVVITGGNGCIGLAMVKGLLAAGADIVSIQIDNDDVAIREAKAHGRTGAVYVADLANKEDVAGLFPRILADGHNPTAFIACAGIQRRGTVLEFEREWLEDLFTVNCTSQFVLARDFARHRAKQLKAHPELGANTSFGRNNGKIVWVASNSSFSGGFLISGYTASKAAVLGIVRSLSNELGPLNIQVNAVAPGFVDTSFTAAITSDKTFVEKTASRIPVGRWAKPDDMVAATIYLTSPASNYTTGQSIIVDGGYLVR